MELSFPTALHFENFVKVWEDADILNSLKNSLILSVTSVTITVIASSMCAYVISRYRTPPEPFYLRLLCYGTDGSREHGNHCKSAQNHSSV